VWNELPKPEGIEPGKNDRVKTAYKPAVKAALQKGKNANDYNNKRLAVIAISDEFQFNAKIEKVEQTRVNITEA